MNKSFIAYLLLLFVVIGIYFMVSSESDEIKKNKKEIELLEAKVKKQGNVSFEKKVKREPKRVEKINVEPKEIVETVKENYVKIYTGSIIEGGVLDIDLDIKNVVYTGSTLEIKFANNNLYLLNDLVEYYRENESKDINYILDGYLINNALGEENNIFYGIEALETISFEGGLDRIMSYKNEDGGFGETPESESDLITTIDFLDKLLLLKYSSLKFPSGTTNDAVNYIIKHNYKELDNDYKIKLFFILKNILKNNNDELGYFNKTKLYFINRTLDIKDELKKIDLIRYKQKEKLYNLVSQIYQKNVIKPNIEDLLNTELSTIEQGNMNLYFYIISQYHLTYSPNKKIKFGYMIGKIKNRREMVRVGKVVESIKTFNYDLTEIEEFGELPFRGANLEGGDLYIKMILNSKKIVKK